MIEHPCSLFTSVSYAPIGAASKAKGSKLQLQVTNVSLMKGARTNCGGVLRKMSAVDDVDELIEQYHLASDEFLKGNPSPTRTSSPVEKT
jgi:hypothetical protein